MILKFKPSIKKDLLYILAGIIWAGVGIMLCTRAVIWLLAYPVNTELLFGIPAIALAIFVYTTGFYKIADKNIKRIHSLPEKVCAFAFQSWKSYLIIILMISMGFILRNSSFPKDYLAFVYIVMGGALLISSIRYKRGGGV